MKYSFFIVFVAVGVCSCNDKSTSYAKRMKTSLRQEWFPNASYLGEVVAINETDTANNLDLELISGSDEIDPIKMVISGTNGFGVAGFERVFTAREKGADLVIIGVVNPINPTCFIAKSNKNVMTPKDFEGKSVGVYPGNNTEMVYRTLIKKTNVDETKIKEVQPSFDLSSFIADAYDVRPAYIFDETVSLDLQKIPYTVVKPQDFGIKFIGNVYFTTRKTIQENPELVQAFVNSIASGWESAINNPVKSVGYLKKFDGSINPTREQLSFAKGITYFKGDDGRILTIAPNRWKEMADYLIQLKMISSYDFGKAVDTSFIHKYHNKK